MTSPPSRCRTLPYCFIDAVCRWGRISLASRLNRVARHTRILAKRGLPLLPNSASLWQFWWILKGTATCYSSPISSTMSRNIRSGTTCWQTTNDQAQSACYCLPISSRNIRSATIYRILPLLPNSASLWQFWWILKGTAACYFSPISSTMSRNIRSGTTHRISH